MNNLLANEPARNTGYKHTAYWMKIAREVALNSPDPSRKTGCVLRTKTGVVAGYNSFPQGVNVTVARLARPTKYTYMEHAERNAIFVAARFGDATKDADMYLPWYPCADCARAIVQAGIARLFCVEPDWLETRYGFRDAETILQEGGVEIIYPESNLPDPEFENGGEG